MPAKIRPVKGYARLNNGGQISLYTVQGASLCDSIPVVIVPLDTFEEMRREIQSIMFDRTNMRTAKQVLADSEMG